MAKVNPYQEQIAPRGVLEEQDTPELEGAGIGRAGVALGAAVGRAGQWIDNMRDDQAKLWATTATAEAEVKLRQNMLNRRNTLDPTSPTYGSDIEGYTNGTMEDTQQAQQDLMDKAPNDRSRQYIALHMASTRVRLMGDALNVQADLNAQYSVDIAQNGIKASSDNLAANPANDTYDDIVGRTAHTIGSLSTVDPGTKQKLIESARHTFGTVQVASVIARDPQGFLQAVGATGGVTTTRGAVKGAVPTGASVPAQPDMLAAANQALSSGKSPVEALQSVTAKFPDQAQKFAFVLSSDGKSFLDRGSPAGSDVPQVQPLDDQAIAQAKVPLNGWGELTWPEKVQAVRQAEAAVGKGLADDRGALARELQDANATALAGKVYPGLDSPRYSEANLVRVFGADQGGRAWRDLQYNQQVGAAVSQMDTMPAAQRAATLTALQPAGGEDFAAKQPHFEAAVRAAQQVAEQQFKAPIDYAIEHGIGNAKPLDFTSPEALMTGLRDRTEVTDIMRKDYGVPAKVFTAGEVDQLAGALGSLAGGDRIKYLMGVRAGLADPGKFGTAMNQLAPKNPLLAYAANMAVQPAFVDIDGKKVPSNDIASKIADGDIILNGRSLDRQMAKGDDPSMPSGSSAVKFDDKSFQLAFSGVLPPTAFQSPDAQQSAATEREIYNAVKAYYVADSYAQGKPLSAIDAKGVKTAIQAVTGGVWKGVGDGGVLMAPFGTDMTTFQQQWEPRATQAITAAGFSADDAARTLDQARPVNLGDGKYGFMVGTRLLQNPNTGDKVVVDYRRPFAGTPSAPKLGDIPAQYQQAPY